MRLARLLVPALLAVALATTAAGAAELTPAPVWQSGTLIGPAKAAAQFAKATFSYSTTTKAMTAKLGSKTVVMTVGSKTAKANGSATTLPLAPKMLNNTLYVPLKNLFNGLGLQVHPSGADWIVCTDQMCLRLKVPPKPQ
jgi:iron-siderophore transport system substrate-binding protein